MPLYLNAFPRQVDFERLEDREDVATFDVPQETVGFLLGAKGAARLRVRSRMGCGGGWGYISSFQ